MTSDQLDNDSIRDDIFTFAEKFVKSRFSLLHGASISIKALKERHKILTLTLTSAWRRRFLSHHWTHDGRGFAPFLLAI